MGFSPGEESLTAPLRLGDRGVAGLWPDQSQERRHGLACQTASGENSWRLFSDASKITDVWIEEREALAQNRKGSIGATERANSLLPSRCRTRDGAASGRCRSRRDMRSNSCPYQRDVGRAWSRWTATARPSRWPGRKAAGGTEPSCMTSPVAGGIKMAMRDHAVPPTSAAPRSARI